MGVSIIRENIAINARAAAPTRDQTFFNVVFIKKTSFLAGLPPRCYTKSLRCAIGLASSAALKLRLGRVNHFTMLMSEVHPELDC